LIIPSMSPTYSDPMTPPPITTIDAGKLLHL
jgi:hypothetical protein